MFSAWRGGLRAGLLATVLSTLIGAFFFLPPTYSFMIGVEDLLELGVFTLAAVIISSLSAAHEKALVREQAARREAEAANAVKDEFLAAVSHELRTPLTTIKTLTRILLHKNPTESERREYLADIASECDRQINLVHNLLDLSRIKTGGVQIKPQRVDVGEVVRACEKIERVEAAEHHHELSVEIAPDLPFIRADQSALRRALCAIVENSVKYTSDGGHINLHAYHDGGSQVAIDIKDNGRGIHAADLPYIFDRFYRGRTVSDSADSLEANPQEVPGIGLGLHLARMLVEGMSGSIEVRSQVGQGSTFTLRLSVWRQETDKQNQERSSSLASFSARNLTNVATE